MIINGSHIVFTNDNYYLMDKVERMDVILDKLRLYIVDAT